MKRLLFLLVMSITALCFTGCSCLDSAPLEPRILAVGQLEYDQQTNAYFLDTESGRYIVDKVWTEDHNPRSFSIEQSLPPMVGMPVTVFISQRTGVKCVLGQKDVPQIETMYHTNSTGVLIFALLLIGCGVGLCLLALIPDKKQKR